MDDLINSLQLSGARGVGNYVAHNPMRLKVGRESLTAVASTRLCTDFFVCGLPGGINNLDSVVPQCIQCGITSSICYERVIH